MKKLFVENLGEIEIGDIVSFYDIWNEQGDIDELIESGAVELNDNIIKFEKIKGKIVKITDII